MRERCLAVAVRKSAEKAVEDPLRYGGGRGTLSTGGEQSRRASVSARGTAWRQTPLLRPIPFALACEYYLQLLDELQSEPTLFNGY
jgi:hypothetical protein